MMLNPTRKNITNHLSTAGSWADLHGLLDLGLRGIFLRWQEGGMAQGSSGSACSRGEA